MSKTSRRFNEGAFVPSTGAKIYLSVSILLLGLMVLAVLYRSDYLSTFVPLSNGHESVLLPRETKAPSSVSKTKGRSAKTDEELAKMAPPSYAEYWGKYAKPPSEVPLAESTPIPSEPLKETDDEPFTEHLELLPLGSAARKPLEYPVLPRLVNVSASKGK